LRKNEGAVLLDSYPAPHKSKKLLKTELWIEPQRQTLPGTVWLANVGMGNLPEELECWHSWNAAKRAASYGYANIYWYRQGVKGWLEAGYPLTTVQPVRP